jgi:hypothetical protein
MTSIAFDDEESRTGAIKKFKGEKKRADAAAKSPYGSKDLLELKDGSYVHVTDSETRKLGFLDDLRASCGDDHLVMIDMLMNKLMIEPNEELRDVGMAHLDDMKAHAESFAQCVAMSLDPARADAYETEFGASPIEEASDCLDQFMISSWFLLRDMKHMRSPQLKELSVGDRLALAKEVRDVSEALMSAAFFKETKDMDKGADKILFYQKAFGLFESLTREAGDMDRAN